MAKTYLHKNGPYKNRVMNFPEEVALHSPDFKVKGTWAGGIPEGHENETATGKINSASLSAMLKKKRINSSGGSGGQLG